MSCARPSVPLGAPALLTHADCVGNGLLPRGGAVRFRHLVDDLVQREPGQEQSEDDAAKVWG